MLHASIIIVNIVRAGNLLIRSSLICSFANFSGHLEEMSDHERIAQVAQRIWATVSESLRLLKTNEQF